MEGFKNIWTRSGSKDRVKRERRKSEGWLDTARRLEGFEANGFSFDGRKEEEEGKNQNEKEGGKEEPKVQLEDDFPWNTDGFKSLIKSADSNTELRERVYKMNKLLNALEGQEKVGIRELDQSIKDTLDAYSRSRQELQTPALKDIVAAVKLEISQDRLGNIKNSGIALIEPPSCLISDLSDSAPTPSLDRTGKLIRCFATIPAFDDTSVNMSIRDFLRAFNLGVQDLGCDVTINEFKNLLLNRLSPRIRSVVSSHIQGKTGFGALLELYRFLQVLYDSSHTRHQAVQALYTDTQSYTTLRDFYVGTCRLLESAGIDDRTKPILFLNALRPLVEESQWEKLLDHVLSFEENHGSPLGLEQLMNYLSRFKESIERSLARQKVDRRKKVYTVQAVQTAPKEPLGTPQSPSHPPVPKAAYRCDICSKVGHTASTCWHANKRCDKCQGPHQTWQCQGPICKKCGMGGHREDQCRSICRLCGGLHNATNCTRYARMQPIKGNCALCLNKGRVLHHATNLCKGWSKN